MKTKTISVLHRSIYFFVIFTITSTFLSWVTFAKTRSHNVTLTVNAVSVISVMPTTVPTLTIPTGGTAVAIAGVDQMTVTDQTTVLKWGTNSTPMKVTIATTNGSPKYTLQVVATNISSTPSGAGLAAAQFTLSTTAQNLITNIALSMGSCNVLYTGIALASQGTGNDIHSITFTITSGS
jgi:hypothetical protein